MSARRFLFRTALLGLIVTCSAAETNAQGLIRRLRNRIAPIIQDQLNKNDEDDQEDESNRLPARTDAARSSGTATAGSNLSRIPPLSSRRDLGLNPAVNPESSQLPGASPNGVPRDGQNGLKARAFGNSILKPFGFGDDESSAIRNSAVRNSPAAGAPSLGITVAEANPGYPAVQIRSIASYASAKQDGLRVGDYIFAIDGLPTPDFKTLSSEVARRNPGDRVVLRIGRRRQVKDLSVMLVAQPAASASRTQTSTSSDYAPATLPVPESGMLPAPKTDRPTLAGVGPELGDSALIEAPLLEEPRNSPGNRSERPSDSATSAIGILTKSVAGRRGVVITKVLPGSPAQGAGLEVNDRIVAVGKRMVSDQSSLNRWLVTARSEEKTSVQIIRNDRIAIRNLDFGYVGNPQDSSTTKNQAKPPRSSSAGLGSMLGGLFRGGNSQAQSPQPESAQPESPEAKSVDAEKAAAPEGDTAAEAEQKQKIQAEIEALKSRLKNLQEELDD